MVESAPGGDTVLDEQANMFDANLATDSLKKGQPAGENLVPNESDTLERKSMTQATESVNINVANGS